MNIQLVVVQGKPAGKALVFGPGDYYLGRGEECHVRFNSEWVSRQHCQVRVGLSIASICDLGSRNGTLVNGRLVEGEQALREGDLVQVGPVVFQIHLDRTTDEATGRTSSDIFHSGESDQPTGERSLGSTEPPGTTSPER